MAKMISGTLYVDAYTSTGNLGEYTFESGLFNNQNDSTGSGAYDLAVGFVIFVTPTDVNTGFPISGTSQRYVITELTVLDTVRLTGTMVFDEVGEEVNPPAPGMFAILAQTTDNHKLAVPLLDVNYPDLAPGSTISALLNDLINIIDKLGAGAVTRNLTRILPVESAGQTVFNLEYAPIDKENSTVTVGGLTYLYGAEFDYSIEGSVLTWSNSSLVLELDDRVVIRYKY